MSIYTVTALTHMLGGKNATEEERKAEAQELVKSLKQGMRVDLKHEPGNPFDKNAVGVYMEWKGEYQQIGYISKSKSKEVKCLIGEDEIGEGVVTKGDDNITFFITLVGVPEVSVESIQTVEQRKLPPYPLVDTILLQTLKREDFLQIAMKKIEKLGKPTVENVREFISLLKFFVNLVGKSLCFEDVEWLENMQNLSDELFDEHNSLGLTEQECDEVGQLKVQIRDIISDFAANKDKVFLVEVMEKELDEYRKLAEGRNGFFEKYDTYYLKKSLENADENTVKQELERLKCWFETSQWAELHNYKRKDVFVERLKYTKFSRRELHEIYSILLLIERLEARVAICTTDANTVPTDKPKEAEGDDAQISDETLRCKIESVKSLIKNNRHWFSVCKYMMWHMVVSDGDFTAAVKKLNEFYPKLNLDPHDLQRLNVLSFRKTLDKWDVEDAPVRGVTFSKYYTIAKKMVDA